ncbi:hypothetical protein CBR_g41268 [Chara braunii]|uniref:Uncharacterized protein n=1 Tax=Chara braunii TaxID=69332 RepID=A0A388LVB9_CHABU|nr:hypothetical protein CBR_g41268 [Chara braunii]|eukprot:GBG86274.1 hypothetical protein CBR_g41268 [Chara braunii]
MARDVARAQAAPTTTRSRRVFGVDNADSEQGIEDDESLLCACDLSAPQVEGGSKPLRRSKRLVSRDSTAAQTETACSQHLEDLQADAPEGEEPEQLTPIRKEASQHSQDIPSGLRTRDFMVGGEERDACIDVEEESRLARMQWAGKVAYLAEVERRRRLETIGAGGDADNVEAVLGEDVASQPLGGGYVSPDPLTPLPYTITDRPAAMHHATPSPSPTLTGHAVVPPVSASPPVPFGSPVSHAPLTSEAGGSGMMDSERMLCVTL